MERIQAIAQNVSDIAVKVDQILRHSLLLHSKGGARRPWTPGGGGAGRDIRAGAPTSPQQPPGLARALFYPLLQSCLSFYLNGTNAHPPPTAQHGSITLHPINHQILFNAQI